MNDPATDRSSTLCRNGAMIVSDRVEKTRARNAEPATTSTAKTIKSHIFLRYVPRSRRSLTANSQAVNTSSSVFIWFMTTRTPSTRFTTSVTSSSVSLSSTCPVKVTTPSSTATSISRMPGYLGRNLVRKRFKVASGTC